MKIRHSKEAEICECLWILQINQVKNTDVLLSEVFIVISLDSLPDFQYSHSQNYKIGCFFSHPS